MLIWKGRVPVCWPRRSIAFSSEKGDKSNWNILQSFFSLELLYYHKFPNFSFYYSKIPCFYFKVMFFIIP